MRLLLLSFLLGCTPEVSVTKVVPDADHDGYDANVDCDDAAQSVHPEAEEVCDGADQDCDGEVDEDATDVQTFYTDADGDGYGDPSTEMSGCTPADGQTTQSGDCDDADAARHPEAAERCNGVDDDCNSAVDDNPTDPVTGYADADGDGYGDATNARTECALPAGYVTDATDCDDAANDVYPGAPEPDCTDPVDHNCDGTTDFADADGDGWAACAECDDHAAAVHPGQTEVCNGLDDDCDASIDGASASDATIWYRDVDTDGWGNDSLTRVDCAAPAGYVAAGGDCDDLDAARSPSQAEVCDGADLDENCSGTADDADPAVDAATFSTFARDADGDGYGDPARTVTLCDAPAGYGVDNTDCDDGNSAVNPTAMEVCDGIDNDCDTQVDDDDIVSGTSTWYADADGDLYGGSSTLTACDAPAGYVASAGDCDDTDAAVNPAEAEQCNGIDDDCNGLVDDDDSGVSNPSTWYRDADGDAYGRSTLSTTACSAPAGYVASAGDCDDTDSLRNPGETEVCDAFNLDEDCSGTADDADPHTDAATFSTWARDADQDSYGDAARTVTQCDMPSGYGVDQSDCDDSSATVYPGATEIAGDGIDEDCDGIDLVLYTGWTSPTIALATADTVLRGTGTEHWVGYALAAPDLDGDGLADIVAGVRNADFMGTNDGAVYIFSGNGGHAGEENLGDADHTLKAEGAGDSAGTAVADLGDVNGDGVDDLLVSGHWNDLPSSNAGRAYVVSGISVPGMAGLRDSWAILTGQSSNDFFSYYLGAAGDVDGDGLGDVLVGASFRDEGGTNAGKAYVFLSGSLAGAGTMSAGLADYTVLGQTAGDYLGEDCASAGDVDNDGLDDFLVGATQIDDSGTTTTGPGRVYLFLGGSLGSTQALRVTDADTTLIGRLSGDAFGQSMGHGNFDGDSYSDLSITAYQNDDRASQAGANYIFLGADILGAGTVQTTDAAVVVTGDVANDELGTRTTLGFDLDRDGLDDLFTGAIYLDLGATDAGVAAVYLNATLMGSSTLRLTDADFRFYGETAGDRAGAALATGDVDGDTVPDLIVGAHKNDVGATDAGAAYVLITP